MEDAVLNRYVIERDMPGVGLNDEAGLCDVAKVSNAALKKLAPRVQWDHSYVTMDKIFCVYIAEDEKAVREHARLSGFPITRITLVKAVIDPTTAK
jgi:hypothetical protein